MGMLPLFLYKRLRWVRTEHLSCKAFTVLGFRLLDPQMSAMKREDPLTGLDSLVLMQSLSSCHHVWAAQFGGLRFILRLKASSLL